MRLQNIKLTTSAAFVRKHINNIWLQKSYRNSLGDITKDIILGFREHEEPKVTAYMRKEHMYALISILQTMNCNMGGDDMVHWSLMKDKDGIKGEYMCRFYLLVF